jgi:hypothetical protein
MSAKKQLLGEIEFRRKDGKGYAYVRVYLKGKDIYLTYRLDAGHMEEHSVPGHPNSVQEWIDEAALAWSWELDGREAKFTAM